MVPSIPVCKTERLDTFELIFVRLIYNDGTVTLWKTEKCSFGLF